MKGVTKKPESEQAKEKVNYTVKVVKAKEVKEGLVNFDMVVNGVSIYGCWYREYTNKQGEEGTMISLPSYKGTDGKYYNHAWIPVSKELKENIEKQLVDMLS